MRTNIVIDDALMTAAMRAGGYATKREAVEEGLRLLARRQTYQGLLALRGQLVWDDSSAARPAWEVEPVQALRVTESDPKPYRQAKTRKAAQAASRKKATPARSEKAK